MARLMLTLPLFCRIQQISIYTRLENTNPADAMHVRFWSQFEQMSIDFDGSALTPADVMQKFNDWRSDPSLNTDPSATQLGDINDIHVTTYHSTPYYTPPAGPHQRPKIWWMLR